MSEFVRKEATASQVEKARERVFSQNTVYVPNGTELTISDFAFVAFSVNGKDSEKATAVIRTNNDDVLVYLGALVKPRVDYKGESNPIEGTLNLWMQSMLGKTFGEIVDEGNKTFKGKKIVAVLKNYHKVDKNGDVRQIFYNEWNIKE